MQTGFLNLKGKKNTSKCDRDLFHYSSAFYLTEVKQIVSCAENTSRAAKHFIRLRRIQSPCYLQLTFDS